MVAELDPPIEIAGAEAIERIDYSARPSGEMFCVLSAEGRLELHCGPSSRESADRRNDYRNHRQRVALESAGRTRDCPTICSFPTKEIMFSRPGRMARCWTSTPATPTIPSWAKRSTWFPKPDERLTALRFLLGKGTLLAGDSLGRVQAWFGVHAAEKGTDEPVRLVMAHAFAGPAAARGAAAEVVCLASSGNSRLFGVGYADRSVRLYYPTNERLVLDTRAPADAAPQRLTLAPRDNGLLGFAGQELVHWTIDPGYPEANLRRFVLAGLVRRNARPVAGLAVGLGLGRLRAEAEPGAADLRHAQGDVLFAVVRRAAWLWAPRSTRANSCVRRCGPRSSRPWK